MATVAGIEDKLKAALRPIRLDIVDESHRHAGHAGVRASLAGARAGGGTHFQVRIVAEAFAGKSRLARQRLVYAALAEEMTGDIHALTVTALTPDEAES